MTTILLAGLVVGTAALVVCWVIAVHTNTDEQVGERLLFLFMAAFVLCCIAMVATGPEPCTDNTTTTCADTGGRP